MTAGCSRVSTGNCPLLTNNCVRIGCVIRKLTGQAQRLSLAPNLRHQTIPNLVAQSRSSSSPAARQSRISVVEVLAFDTVLILCSRLGPGGKTEPSLSGSQKKRRGRPNPADAWGAANDIFAPKPSAAWSRSG